ncbi:MAG TPA: hypothetical protein VHX86_01700 [Tepidisphaeraceae bacterium]|nr:hypothetical protein [Tepidisphaeraceae bacterium]
MAQNALQEIDQFFVEVEPKRDGRRACHFLLALERTIVIIGRREAFNANCRTDAPFVVQF